jgi:4-hydroxybenzoate polyprenyltransferase
MENTHIKKNRPRVEKKFALTLSCVLGFLGGVVLWRIGKTALLFWGIGIVVLLMDLTWARLLWLI